MPARSVAVSWFVAFAAHALHRWPEHRDRLGSGDPAFAEAFAHEVRRFYPFAPFVGGLAVRDLEWRSHPVPAGTMVLLDLYGQNHLSDLWEAPYSFRPQRFLDRSAGQFDLVPQGAGDAATGHRCPGEPATVALLGALVQRLARMDWVLVSGQDCGSRWSGAGAAPQPGPDRGTRRRLSRGRPATRRRTARRRTVVSTRLSAWAPRRCQGAARRRRRLAPGSAPGR